MLPALPFLRPAGLLTGQHPSGLRKNALPPNFDLLKFPAKDEFKTQGGAPCFQTNRRKYSVHFKSYINAGGKFLSNTCIRGLPFFSLRVLKIVQFT